MASSAGFDGGNYASITIDHVPVRIKDGRKNPEKTRGLHISVINPF